MINDVKLENISTPTAAKKAHLSEPNNKPAPAASVESVTISTGLSRHINALLTENNVPDENARVAEMKNRIASNGYSVDTDRLAKKIFQDMFAKI